MDNAYFDQAEQNIILLLSDKKYSEAYNLCKELIKKNPEYKGFIQLKEKIEKEIIEENNRIAEEKIDEFEKLWGKEKYAEILQEIKKLLKIAPENKKLKNYQQKAQEAYKKQIEKSQKEFINNQYNRFNKLLAENGTNEILEDLFALEKDNPGNKEIQKLTKYFRDQLIIKKIKEKNDLIYSSKFDDIFNLISQLKKIDPENENIENLIKLTNKRKHDFLISEKSEFFYSGEKQLDTLIQLKKYNFAIKAAEELLLVDPENKSVLQKLEKARNEYFKQTNEATLNSISQNLPKLKEDYKKNKDKYINL